MTEGEWPATRWSIERVGHSHADYRDRFARLFADGTDIDGEARLLDVLLPRGAAVLDAGSGTGRVAAALAERGHRVVGVDADADLVEDARARYPGVPFVVADLQAVDGGLLAAAALPELVDAVVLAGNVMVFLAPGTEAAVLAGLAALLAPAGVLVTGFALDRVYTLAQFDADAAAAGLVLQNRFGTWHLDPLTAGDDWAVSVLRRA